MTRWTGLTAWMVAGAACGPADISIGYTGFATGGVGATDVTESGVDSTSMQEEDATSDEPTGVTTMGFPDVGEVPPPMPPPDDGIPTTCTEAAAQDSTVGCRFFAADLDGHPLNQAEPWGVTVGNVQSEEDGAVAHVLAEVRIGGQWRTLEEVDLAPGELHLFLPPQSPHEATLRLEGATVRIDSDVPIIAHQFNPIAKARATSDASMLYPVTAWDSDYVVMGRPHIGEDAAGELYPYVTIVASSDDTVVEIVPPVDTRTGLGVAAGSAGELMEVTLQEGELLQIAPAATTAGVSLTGMKIDAPALKPIAVFTAHRCAYVPADTEACDHLEEQMSGRHQWGRTYAAVRAMPRLDVPEPVLWQIVAAADTTIEFRAHDDVTGLPSDPVALDEGEALEFLVAGSALHPGDFVIESEEPIALMQYPIGAAQAGNFGDPSAIQLAPIDQFIERLVLLVPEKWAEDHLAITRKAGSNVWLDGEIVDEVHFAPIDSAGELEAARVLVSDGVHTLVGSEPLSAIVVGYDAWDSYGYLGGARTSTIYQPAG